MKRSKPRLSIGVPVRNGERFLAETLDSLLAQTFEDFELIISDNASTDQTETICRAYAEKDPRVRYYRASQDIGLASNYNHLFIRSRGEYFKWAAADDLHEPEYVSRCLEVLEHDPSTVLAYAKARFIDQDGAPLEDTDPGFKLQSSLARERVRYVIHAGSWVNAIFGVIRSKALAKTRLMPSYPGGDYPLLGELALEGKFVEIPEPLFLRRLHPAASSQNTHDLAYLVQLWTANGKKVFPVWSRSQDEIISIMRSDLGFGEKISLTGSVLRSMVTRRRRLWAELKGYLQP